MHDSLPYPAGFYSLFKILKKTGGPRCSPITTASKSPLNNYAGFGYDWPVKKRSLLLLTLFSLTTVVPASAGTSVKAILESLTRKTAWVNLTASIDNGRMRLDFEGPTAHGALIYDRESSLLTLVDHLHKTTLSLSPENQAAVKLLLAVFSGRLSGQIEGQDAAVDQAYELAKENAQAFFNGDPKLEKKGVSRAGFTCDEYVTDLLGAKAREVWVTTPSKAGISTEDYNTFRSLVHLMLDLGAPVLAQLGVDADGFEQNLSDPQWPVAEVLYAKAKASVSFKIVDLRPQSFIDGIFSPPQRYRILSLMDLLKQGGGPSNNVQEGKGP